MASLAIEVLGSGGAVRTPRPGCTCPLCSGARLHGIPWACTGPSLFVHGPNLLIDTPEESALQLDRSTARTVAAGLYSHWHPDHTRGCRVWETRNADFRHWPPLHAPTPIYLPARVRADFERYGILESFQYKERMGYITLHDFDTPLTFGGWRVTAFPLAEEYVYAFHMEEIEGGRRVLICMDELHGWTPPDWLRGVDLVVMPKGLFEFHPESGERFIPADHPVLNSEATWEQTLTMVRALAPQRVLFMHLEEPDRLTPPDYVALAARVQQQEGIAITFAWDTLVVELP